MEAPKILIKPIEHTSNSKLGHSPQWNGVHLQMTIGSFTQPMLNSTEARNLRLGSLVLSQEGGKTPPFGGI